jgi:zinc transporter, ZIP family
VDTVWQVLIVAIASDLATGLGALPFAFVPALAPRFEGWANALAGGMMLSASVFTLASKALTVGGVWPVSAGLLAGAGFFALTARIVSDRDWQIHNLSSADSRRAVLIVVAMFMHSIPEGVAIGVGYATGEVRYGLLLGLAIAVHNVPEGAAVSLPLRAKGVPVWACAGYAILTSVPQPLMAVPSYLLVETFQRLLPFGLGFAGGAMIFLVAAELIPESLERCSRYETAWGVMGGLLIMLWLTTGMGL